jgi:hypothetical protein
MIALKASIPEYRKRTLRDGVFSRKVKNISNTATNIYTITATPTLPIIL